ncbi:uncharacterized protein LOC107031709 [Solanum pennellii]|uniref:Uncharacterized protein LOC107031709 n=1 Tax=Solanum pennellii TaxID=28526 RepID=A0ABM1HPW6_SOLPN|nr:uncharacterized protein LOC107031709 [Solanum pennellii]
MIQAQPPPHPFFLFSPLFSFTFFFSSFPPHLTANSSHEDQKRAAPLVSNSGGNCQQQPMKQQATNRQPKADLTPAKAARSSGKANSDVVSEGFKWAKRWIFNRSVPVSYCFIFSHVIHELSSAKVTRISII